MLAKLGPWATYVPLMRPTWQPLLTNEIEQTVSTMQKALGEYPVGLIGRVLSAQWKS
jgi:ABC-type cobalt transport system substrate-binding protein